MSDRQVLRVKCDRGRHTVATVAASPEGYDVDLREIVATGYGNRFSVHRSQHRLDGPASDPEVWVRYGGCLCGHQFVISGGWLRAAIDRGDRVVTAPELRDQEWPRMP